MISLFFRDAIKGFHVPHFKRRRNLLVSYISTSVIVNKGWGMNNRRKNIGLFTRFVRNNFGTVSETIYRVSVLALPLV